MRCFESFDGLCKQIVSPARFKINESEISWSSLTQSSAKPNPCSSSIASSRSSAIAISTSPASYSSTICRGYRLSCTCMATAAVKWKFYPSSVSKISGLMSVHLTFRGVGGVTANTLLTDQTKPLMWNPSWTIYGGPSKYTRYTFGDAGTDHITLSMGACAAILYAAHTSESMIRSMILDCPFTCL